MPTNVTREYLEAQQKYSEARTLEEKIEALKLMLSTVPKHKGTERLRYELKKNLANKRRELQAREQKKVSQHQGFDIPREGIAQVLLIGPPNSGKSLILNKLTSSHAKVAPYPFTSTEPSPGMLNFEDVQIQLVEMPALIEDVSEGRWLGPRMFSMLRNADALVVVLDLADDPAGQMDMIVRELRAAKLRLKGKASTGIRKSSEISGVKRGVAEDGRLLIINGSTPQPSGNTSTLSNEKVQGDDLVDVLDSSFVYKNAFVLANKGDLPGSEGSFKDLVERYGKDFAIFPVSAEKGHGLEGLGKAVFELLDVIRIYTKVPGQKRETRPLVLPRGSAVLDVAESLHKRFVSNFRFARVWGSSVNFGGEMVGLEHVLDDGDVVELHAR